MPAAPPLLRTRSHALCKTSLRQIRSNKAWKRRPGSRLATRKSARWSSRTLSVGLLGLAAMPSHLPPSTRTTKAGSLPSAGVVATGIVGTTNPSDSLPARLPFALGLWAPPLPDVGCWVGPLLFRIELSSHALLSTPGKSCAAPCSGAVCCLRRDMIGSAFPPFGSLLSRGCKVHPLGLGLRRCSPRPSNTARRGLLTLRLADAISRGNWSLLRGASALTAAGLAPASSTQHRLTSDEDWRSGHTMPRSLAGRFSQGKRCRCHCQHAVPSCAASQAFWPRCGRMGPISPAVQPHG